jgi:Uma2 family endonuclease
MTTAAPKPVTTRERPIPPLENGDRLSAAEFERHYETMKVGKAELVGGIAYIQAAVSAEFHGDPHADLTGWLGCYRARTPGVRVSDNATLRLDEENVYQPDASLRLPANAQGTASVGSDGFLEGVTELVAEVSGTTASLDLHAKLAAYQRYGVREYIVWRVRDETLDWMILRGGRYAPLASADGIYRSETFPGLWLDAQALVRGDIKRVLDVLDQGTATPEHAAFVRRLAGLANQA